MLRALLCVVVASRDVSAKKGKMPAGVKPGSTGWGGGSVDTPGHGKSMQENGHKVPMMELSSLPTFDEFYQNYIRPNKPVVIRGAGKNQRAFGLWTDEYLTKKWNAKTGSKMIVEAETAKVEVRGGKSEQMPFEKFVKEIYKPSRANELYAVIGLEDQPEALADIDFPAPARCKEIWPQSATLWMSNGGTKSVLHYDDGENFLVLLDGSKSLMLVHQDEAPNIYAPIAKQGGTSPVLQDNVDLEAFPRFANVTWTHGNAEAGDMVYIPHSYWHQVNSVGRNLAVNIWWQHKEDFKWFDVKTYKPAEFGSPTLPSFDKYKASAATSVPCTPMDVNQHMGKTPLVDEGVTKKRFGKLRNKWLKESKDKSDKKEL